MESSDALCTVQSEVTSEDISVATDAPSPSIDGASSLKRSLRSPSPADGDRALAISQDTEDVSFTVVSSRKRKNKKKRRNTLLTSSSEAPASPPSLMDVVVEPPSSVCLAQAPLPYRNDSLP
ncbi:hypothetical protein ACJJTC_010511 [Scirpophaga incertulas]